MLNIKEIALKVADSLRNKIDGISHMQSNQGLVRFAEALIAEVAKGNEPCAFLHEWIEYHPFGDTFVGEPCATITNDEKPFDSSDTVSPLFTFPPTAEQIANETAEAWMAVIKKMEANYDKDIRDGDLYKATACEFIAKSLRSGAWKEFKK